MEGERVERAHLANPEDEAAIAEAIADVVFRPAPLDAVTASEMIDDLATQKLLGEFRGEHAVDRQQLVEVLVGLGRLAVERTDIASVDINPVE